MARETQTIKEEKLTTRRVLEFKSRTGAGVIEEVGDYLWVRVLDQFEMYVHKDDQSVTPCLVQDGFWESWITQYVINRMGPGSVFIDVGANTGYYSLVARYHGAMVASFEPNPVYYDMFKATLERNGNPPLMRVSNTAISDKSGTETLYIPKHLHGSASFSELDAKWETTPIEVRTETLGVDAAGAYFVKIDAEGAEEKIWDGMVSRGLHRRIGPIEILLEYTPGAYSDSFIDKLESYAPLYWINGDAEAEPVSREWLLNQPDWVMLSLEPNRRYN